MAQERQLVSFDWAMKHLLRNKANFDILEGFLSELLREEVVIEEILESEGNQEHSEDKFNRVDLLTHLKDGPHLIIELQCDQQLDYLSRILYGTCKLITEQIQLGKPYAEVKKVISISILYFDLGEGTDYIYRGTTQYRGIHNGEILSLREEERKAYREAAQLPFKEVKEIYPEYYLLQVKRFPQVVRDTMDEWMYFLRTETIEPNFTAKGLRSAKEKLDLLKLSPQERKQYHSHWERMSQESSMVLSHYQRGKWEGIAEGEEKGRQEGEKKGRKEGIEEGKREIVRKLLGLMQAEEIAKVTGLSLAEIEKLS